MDLGHWIDDRRAERYWLWRRFCVGGGSMIGFAVVAAIAYATADLAHGDGFWMSMTVLFGLGSGWQFAKMVVAGYRLSRV